MGRASAATGDLPVRDDLVGLHPYGAPQLDVPVRLNTNENPYPPPETVVRAIGAAVAEAARHANRYPDREHWALREALAAYLAEESGVELAPGRLWAGNGSNEVLQQVLLAFGGPNRTALGFAPGYAMYPEYARNALTRWVTVARRSDFSLDLDAARAAMAELRPSVVFLTSPNNPTGTALTLDEVAAVAAAAPGVVVVDEAYAEFRRAGVPSALELLDRFPRLVVSRTMSKAFALAGARVGYLAGDPAIIDALRIVRLPYHLSSITQAAARAALAHRSELLADLERIRSERDATVAWLRTRGLSVADSDANFAWFGTFPDRHAVWEGCLSRGVLVREVGPEGWLRVSIGTPDEMGAFREALTATLGWDASRSGPQAG